MSEAVGIHAHETLKLGLRPPKNAPALRLEHYLTGVIPEHPAATDHFKTIEFGLYGNDKFGVCGPTSVANLVRLVTAALLGTPTQPSQDDVFDLYRRSGNPGFDPNTGADDNGVDMQTMLEALLKDGIGGVKPVAFARVNQNSDEEMDAAESIFGGLLWGVNLMTAQQSQTTKKLWDYSPSPEWGGHAILGGQYDENSGRDGVITWAMVVELTEAFRRNQLGEAWAVIWPWNIQHPAFQQGVDIVALATDFLDLTGQKLPV